jgi:hypothetical protein
MMQEQQREAEMKSVRSNLLFASGRNAAALLDMKLTEFLGLVQEDVLPKPMVIGSHERWDVEQLQAIVRGDAAEGVGQVNW